MYFTKRINNPSFYQEVNTAYENPQTEEELK